MNIAMPKNKLRSPLPVSERVAAEAGDIAPVESMHPRAHLHVACTLAAVGADAVSREVETVVAC